ncbi:MAG: hypothetical protein CML20_17250 [Rheinheimera sp.]|uniref:hypothetical protein n=1 Tax=Arsukibacterium sp. UBA3155 TaxID=1946058 RepID=UPI000C924E77|nr:hypothetical protein [Arsukibacterium sp. UBA3155]MAD76506.1 hypothetical protein [Rheinheimera sp.]|tara:strand:- start:156995 stop:157423 length:429 start_codon:yes stop_codon:yes gene_type:complete
MSINIIYGNSPSVTEGVNTKQKSQFDNNLTNDKFSIQLEYKLQINEALPPAKKSAKLASLGDPVTKNVSEDVSLLSKKQQSSLLQNQLLQPPLSLQAKLNEAFAKQPQPDVDKAALSEHKTERLSTKPEYWVSPPDLGSDTY